MGVAITREQLSLQLSVRRWAAAARPRDVVRAREHHPSPDGGLDACWTGATELGLVAAGLPGKLGGADGDLLDTAVALEAAAGDLVPGPLLPTTLAALLLARHADPDTAGRLVPDLADGTSRAAVALAPGDLTARREPDGALRVDGAVTAVLGAAPGTHLVLAARRRYRPGRLVRARARRCRRHGRAAPPARLLPRRRRRPLRRGPRPGRRGAADGDHGRRARPRRDARRGRGRRRRGVVPRHRDRLRRRPRAVRPPHRRVPGGQAPLRRHALPRRAGGRRRLGRRPRATARTTGRTTASRRSRPRSPPRSRSTPRSTTPRTASRCSAASASPGSTTPTSTCAARSRRASCSAAARRGGSARRRSRRDGARRRLHLDLGPAGEADDAAGRRASGTSSPALPADRRSAGAPLADSGYLVPHWPAPVRAAARPAREQLVIDEELSRGRRATGRTWSSAAGRCPRSSATAPTSSRSASSGPTLRGEITWCQLFSEPGPAPTSRRCAPAPTRGRRRLARSPGRRSGRRWPHEADWAICLARTDPDAPQAQRASRYFLVDMREPRHRRSGRCGRSPARPRSTRCSSTTCSCPTTAWSARSAAAGGWRAPRWPTSGSRSAAAPRSATGVERSARPGR